MDRALIAVFVGAASLVYGLLSLDRKGATPASEPPVIDHEPEATNIPADAVSDPDGGNDLRGSDTPADPAGGKLNLDQVDD